MEAISEELHNPNYQLHCYMLALYLFTLTRQASCDGTETVCFACEPLASDTKA